MSALASSRISVTNAWMAKCHGSSEILAYCQIVVREQITKPNKSNRAFICQILWSSLEVAEFQPFSHKPTSCGISVHPRHINKNAVNRKSIRDVPFALTFIRWPYQGEQMACKVFFKDKYPYSSGEETKHRPGSLNKVMTGLHNIWFSMDITAHLCAVISPHLPRNVKYWKRRRTTAELGNPTLVTTHNLKRNDHYYSLFFAAAMSQEFVQRTHSWTNCHGLIISAAWPQNDPAKKKTR